ncbi:S41 family peptidase [Microaceticoccus formicicus]|uniref:S41 family peptidase n=1 Tax=Microaceticoccus formicicus TaxID=3118105 RepID=UPI003CD027E3|nr:S41 family peptidase [Peptoniphilaceae bacterium AMB_02]
MKNKFTKIFALILAALVLTSCAGSQVKVNSDNSVTLTGEEYKYYMENKDKIDKINYLTEKIKKDFLFDIDEEKLEAGIYKGLFAALNDPYSSYYTKSEFNKLLEDSSGEFGGIGVVVSAMYGEYITVVSPIEGTPGERAGLLTGDKIIMVDGETYFAVDMDKAIDHMRGEPGTDVTLTIRREDKDGNYEDFEVSITREIIKIDSVKSQMLEGDLGYISIASFDENTAGDFKDAIDSIKENGAKGLVLDLRNNPGGLLDSVVTISDILLPKGTIVSTVDRNGKRSQEMSDAKMEDIPLVVLVNQGSASASEILSGAIKDFNRGEIIGTQTFGKGIVQRIFPLNDGGYKLTISEYYTPNDTKINGVGVTPDTIVEMPEASTPMGPENFSEDVQLQKAIEVLQNKI